MTRRPGLTVIEAMVAMFVAALGMIALLVLFPLGAVQMGQALKDERTAQTARKATGLMRSYWQTDVVDRGGYPGVPNIPGFPLPPGPDPFVLAFTDPNDNWHGYDPVTGNPVPNGAPQLPYTNPAAPPPTVPAVTPLYSENVIPFPSRPLPGPIGPVYPPLPGGYNGPSYPVYLDLIGWQARNGGTVADRQRQFWTAGNLLTGAPHLGTRCIPRRTLRSIGFEQAAPNTRITPLMYDQAPPATKGVYATSTAGAVTPSTLQLSIQFATLTDDLSYNETGEAIGPAGTVERLGWYNFGVMLQRPNNQTRTVADMHVMVFEKRAPAFAAPGSERQYPRDSGLPLNAAGAPLQNVIVQPGQSVVRIYYTGEPPAISKGRWIMDGTLDPGPFPPSPANSVTATLPPAPDHQPILVAKFYRVVATTLGEDPAVGNTPFMDVELQTPILPPGGVDVGRLRASRTHPVTGAALPSTAAEPNPQPGAYVGQIYVFQGLSEVFNVPPLVPTTSRPLSQ